MGGWLKKLVHVNGGPEARGVRKNATQSRRREKEFNERKRIATRKEFSISVESPPQSQPHSPSRHRRLSSRSDPPTRQTRTSVLRRRGLSGPRRHFRTSVIWARQLVSSLSSPEAGAGPVSRARLEGGRKGTSFTRLQASRGPRSYGWRRLPARPIPPVVRSAERPGAE